MIEKFFGFNTENARWVRTGVRTSRFLQFARLALIL